MYERFCSVNPVLVLQAGPSARLHSLARLPLLIVRCDGLHIPWGACWYSVYGCLPTAWTTEVSVAPAGLIWQGVQCETKLPLWAAWGTRWSGVDQRCDKFWGEIQQLCGDLLQIKVVLHVVRKFSGVWLIVCREEGNYCFLGGFSVKKNGTEVLQFLRESQIAWLHNASLMRN